MGRWRGNPPVVRCKFGERPALKRRPNAEPSPRESAVRCRGHNHPPKPKTGMVKAWSRPRTNSILDCGGESRSGMHNPLVQGSNPCGPTNLKRSNQNPASSAGFAPRDFRPRTRRLLPDLCRPSGINQVPGEFLCIRMIGYREALAQRVFRFVRGRKFVGV